jgi:hypothetical protein
MKPLNIALALFLSVSGVTGSLSAAEPVSKAGARPAARKAVPFIEDDYPKALALARARKLPLFIESWAPW